MKLAEIKERIERLQRWSRAMHEELRYIVDALSSAPDKEAEAVSSPSPAPAPAPAGVKVPSPIPSGPSCHPICPECHKIQMHSLPEGDGRFACPQCNPDLWGHPPNPNAPATLDFSRQPGAWGDIEQHKPEPMPVPLPAPAPAPGTRSSGPKYEFKGLDCPVHGQAPHKRERHTLGPWICDECHSTKTQPRDQHADHQASD